MAASQDKPDISATSVVAATEEHVSSDVGDETILLSMQSAMYYGLDSVGSRIWELVRAPIQVSQIQEIITEEYEVERDQCAADILDFLRQLADKGLLEVKNRG